MWSASTVMFGVGAHGGDERALDLAAGGVLGVDDAAGGVAAFARQIEGAAVVGVEVGAVAIDELADGLRAVAHAELDDVLVAQPFADGERVRDVGVEASRPDRGRRRCRPARSWCSIPRRRAW